MSDEKTSGFTSIEEDASTATDVEQHLKIEIRDFRGDAHPGLNSYLNLGFWAPSTAAGTVSGGELSDPVDDLSAFAKDPATGDDLLAAFIQSGYLDDQRDRFDGNVPQDPHATPGLDLTKFAQSPRLEAVTASLTDGVDLFPGSEDATGPFYLSQAARQAVTKKLPTYVGWRDHTEGHRITTTRGDKIEVVGGNYKLISLGRGMGTVTSEWAGGHRVDVLEAPGNVTSINWRPVPSEDGQEPGWQWVEETVKGNVVERFHGTMRTEFYGDELIEIVGRSDESVPGAVDDFGEGADETGTFEDVGALAEADNRWDAIGGLPPKRQKPRIVSKVRGRLGFDEVHSTGPIVDVEIADEMHDFIGAPPVLDEGTVETVEDSPEFGVAGAPAYRRVEIPEEAWDRRPELVQSHVVAGSMSEVRTGARVFDSRSCDHFVSRYNANATETWRSNFIEKFVGGQMQLFGGMNIAFQMPMVNELYLGAKVSLTVGVHADLQTAAGDVTLLQEVSAEASADKATISKFSAVLNDAEAALVTYEQTMSSINPKVNRKMS